MHGVSPGSLVFVGLLRLVGRSCCSVIIFIKPVTVGMLERGEGLLLEGHVFSERGSLIAVAGPRGRGPGPTATAETPFIQTLYEHEAQEKPSVVLMRFWRTSSARTAPQRIPSRAALRENLSNQQIMRIKRSLCFMFDGAFKAPRVKNRGPLGSVTAVMDDLASANPGAGRRGF